MRPIPTYDGQITELLPLVKEVGGKFFWLGISMKSLPFGQWVPEQFRDTLKAWSDGPAWEHIRKVFIERGQAQKAANRYQPKPVLSEEELDGYPLEFWPWLRRLPNGHVGMTEQFCSSNPGILDLYEVWERQNKPDYARKPDPRCEA